MLAALMCCSLSKASVAADVTKATQVAQKIFNKGPTFQAKMRPNVVQAIEEKGVDIEARDFGLPVKKITLNHAMVHSGALADLKQAYEGRSHSFEELSLLAKRMTRRCRADGVMLCNIYLPTQDVKDGTVNLTMVEGYVDAVVYHGKTDLKNRNVESIMDTLLNAKPLTAEVFDRALMLINDLPGVQAHITFAPSKQNEGATIVHVCLTEALAHLSARLDNDGTESLGPWQFKGHITVNNFMGHNQSLSVASAIVPKSAEMYLFALNYSVPVVWDGLYVDVSGQIMRSHPGAEQRSLDMHGKNDHITFGGHYALVRSQYTTLTLGATVTIKNADDHVRSSGRKTRDHLRIFEMHSVLDFSDKFWGKNQIRGAIVKGLSGFGSTKNGSLHSRISGDVNFVKLDYLVTRYQDWGRGLSGLFIFRGQYSMNPLLDTERFGLGGPPYNRAYPTATFTGDSGFELRLEVQYAFPDAPVAERMAVYAFYTHGHVRNLRPLADEKKCYKLNGMGLGVQSKLMSFLSSSLEYTVPLKKKFSGGKKVKNKIYFGLSVDL